MSTKIVWNNIEDVIANPNKLHRGDWIRGIGDVLSEQQRLDIVAVCKAIRTQMTRDSYLGRIQSENTRLRAIVENCLQILSNS